VFSANSGSNLSIDVSGGNGGVGAGNGVGTNAASGLLNNNVIQATGGSTITLEGGLYENAVGGIIRANNGSTVALGNDARILNGTLTSVGTGVITAYGANQYLNNVTLSSGSNLRVRDGTLYLNTAFTNNGTLTVGGTTGTADLRAENALTITGSGVIVLDSSLGAARLFSNSITFGSNQSLQGAGQLGVNQTIITNNGVFSANSGSNLSIDVSGGNGGVGLNNGVGTNGASGLLNNNIIQATGGSTISFEGGLYENAVGGIIRASNGSTIAINNDARILNGTLTSDATSQITAYGANQYLNNVTLSSGSNLRVRDGTLYLNTAFTNNGTLTVGGTTGTADLRAENALTIAGSGVIVLDSSLGAARLFSNSITFGANQSLQGAGQLGLNQTIVTNHGLISATAGGGISIDASGGNGGVGAGNGVGTSGASGLLNTGVIQANGAALALEGGRYENSATGTFAALTGSTFTMNGDASLFNLQAGGVLSQGAYVSSTTGAASTLNLRSNAANSIVTIGSNTPGADTTVTLSGANSTINVLNFGSAAATSIDASLTGVAQSGVFQVLNGRNFNVTAGGGAFSNAGVVQLGGGTFGAASYANSGLTTGSGVVSVAIVNTGVVEAAGGVLATQAITGNTGAMRSLAGATLDISGAAGNSTAGFLTNNGALALGANSVTVTNDYVNASFGAGNAFNGHANVSGSGQILAASATMDLSGPGLSGLTLDVGNVRTGGSSSTNLTITNNGLSTTLRGAVQNTNAPSVALAGADWVAGPNGGSADVGISYTGLSAGSLAGQTLSIVNNFDNVGDVTLNLAGNVYQAAQAGALPASINLAARRVGDVAATSVITISNVAPVTPGFNEALQANASVGGGFQLNGGASASANALAAGNNTSITLSHLTTVAGAFSDTVNVTNTSLAVAGSGLTDLALAGQSVTVTGNVYAVAVADLSSNTVDFGVVRQGAADPTASLTIANAATGALADSLVTTVDTLPAGVSGTAPGTLAQGASGDAIFTLDTMTAGVVNGSGSLGFTSVNPELADLALPSQSVQFTGTVTEVSVATLFSTGAGTFSGSGGSYLLNLGALSADSGIFTADIGVLNAILASSYSETLGGGFLFGGGSGYSFSGGSFAGLAGGQSDIGNLLSFNTAGRGAGAYNSLLTFNGFSSFAGLDDYQLGPITLQISATITGAGGPGAVPEPSTWAMVILGFGAIGQALRRRRSGARRRLAA
jgi:hypothetical protein